MKSVIKKKLFYVIPVYCIPIRAEEIKTFCHHQILKLKITDNSGQYPVFRSCFFKVYLGQSSIHRKVTLSTT